MVKKTNLRRKDIHAVRILLNANTFFPHFNNVLSIIIDFY